MATKINTSRGVLACLAALAVALGVARPGGAGDWPHYRGPNRDGTTTDGIDRWPPVELWRAQVGYGFSAVTVSQGKVYTAGWAGGQDTVYRFDENYSGGGTQSPLHTYSYECGSVEYEGTRCTPAVDVANGRVYMFSHQGFLVCLNASNLSRVWDLSLGTGGRPGWGFGSSPLIEGNLVIVNKGAAGTAVNIDGTTHTVQWGGGNGGAGYATPFAYGSGASRRIVIYGGNNVSGVDTGGTVRWYFDWDEGMADPIVYNGYAWASRGYGKGATVRQIGTGNLTTAAWSSTVMRNKENCSVFHNGYVYGIDEGNSLKCIDFATGDEEWSQGGFGTESSLMMANGELVVMSGKNGSSPANGNLVVVAASPSAYSELHRQNNILGLGAGSKTWTTPTVANGKLYLRSHTGLVVCYDVSGSSTTHTITVASNPTGRTVTVGGSSYTTPRNFSWAEGSTHTLGAPTPQSGASGTRYAFSSWAANPNLSGSTYTVPTANDTVTANFTTQYMLATVASPSNGGSVNPPASSWHNSGATVSVQATADQYWSFSHWTGDLSGSTNPRNVTMSSPRSVTAVFDPDDTDLDQMPDWWEVLYSLDPDDSGDAAEDADGDGVSNLDEYLAGTNPVVDDSSGSDSGVFSCAPALGDPLGCALVLLLAAVMRRTSSHHHP